MTVGLHRQDAAVFMPEPAAKGRDVDTRFNADRGENVAKIMVRDAFDPELSASLVDRLLTFGHGENIFFTTAPVWIANRARLIAQIGKEPAKCGKDRNLSAIPILCPGQWVAVDPDRARGEIDIVPCDESSLGQPASGIGEKFYQVAALLRTPSPGCSDALYYFGEFGLARKLKLFTPDLCLTEFGGRILVDRTGFYAESENRPKTIDGVIEPGRGNLIFIFRGPIPAIVFADPRNPRVGQFRP